MKKMKTRYKIIIGISIPLIIIGIFVLLIAINVSHMLENSERWMVELEPHLELSADQLESQIKNEDLKELRLYRVQTLEDYFESLTPNFERQFKAVIDTEHRFVVSIDENSGYSEQQIQEIFTGIDGIKDWLLR
jgi:preprotein translocase subunit SecF